MNKISLFEEAVSQAVQSLVIAQPPQDLVDRIILAVLKKKKFYDSVRFFSYSFLALLSCVGCVVVWKMEGSNILNSKLVELLSLLFSDFGVVVSFWREYALSVLEAVPVFSIFFVSLFVWFTIVFVWKTIIAGNLFIINRSVKQLKF